MPAKGSSAAALHGPKCLQLLIAESGLEVLQKLVALRRTMSATSMAGRVMDADGDRRRLLVDARQSCSPSMGLTTFCRCCADRCR